MSCRLAICTVTLIMFGYSQGLEMAGVQETAADQGVPAAATADPQTASVAEIKAAIASYVAAFNARDAEKLASHWAPEGVYISRSSGEQVTGREAMVAEFKQLFAEENTPTLDLITESIDFVSPNVAVERGLATTTVDETEVSATRYSAVFVRQNGAWLIDRVTEDELVVENSNRENLEPLDWLIGEWVDDPESVGVELNCQWTRNDNFISMAFKVYDDDGEVASSGLQIIGWDAANKRIRSWLFDSDGTVVLGNWNQRDDQWIAQSTAELADGGKGSYTTIFRPLEAGNLSWRKINQMVDGQLLPNADELVLLKK